MLKTTPTINYESYKDECIELNKAIDCKDSKNIAITGGYGSGKSSLIKTFEIGFNNKNGAKIVKSYNRSNNQNLENKDEERDNKENLINDASYIDPLDKKLKDLYESQKKKTNTKKLKHKSLFVSMASFNLVGDNDKLNDEDNNRNNKEKDKTNLTPKEKIVEEINNLTYKESRQNRLDYCDESYIEKNILQQMLFNVNGNQLPKSNIKRVSNETKFNLFKKISLYITFIITLISATLFILNKNSIFWNKNNLWDKRLLILLIIAFILFLIFLPTVFRIKTLKIDKLEIESEVKKDDNKIDYFSKYIDELIYFFKKTKYKIVYFEDLDRLPSLTIFNKLRELNFVLNNSSEIDYKITFVYCVSDSIIADQEERGKFFDEIIVVNPYITKEKAKSNINVMLNGIIKGDYIFFSEQMANFIDNSRLLINVEKDLKYKLDKFTISTELELKKAFAISLYQNLYHKDYNKIANNNSCLSRIFDLIRLLRAEAVESFNEKIFEYENLLKDSKKEDDNNLDVLKARILGSIILAAHNSIYDVRYSDRYLAVGIVKNWEDIINATRFGIDNYKTITKDNLNKYFKDNCGITFDEYLSRVKLKHEKYKQEIFDEIEKEKVKKRNIYLQSIADFMKNVNKEDIPNEFLYTCFKNGYIDSDYLKYVYGNNDSFLPENEDAFVRYNNYNEKETNIKGFEYPIRQEFMELIKNNIHKEKFASINILNVSFVDYMIQSVHDEKYMLLFKYLNTDDQEVRKFNREYIKISNIDSCKTYFKLFINSKSLLLSFVDILNVLDENKRNAILQVVLDEDFDQLSNKNREIVTKLLNSNDNWMDVNVDVTIKNNIQKLDNVSFKSIYGLNDDSIKLIVEDCLFEINIDNIKLISNRIFNNKEIRLFVSSIFKLSDSKFKTYLLDNLENIIQFIMENPILEEDELIGILRDDQIAEDVKQSLIKSCDFIISDIDQIENKYIKQIIEFDKIQKDICTIFKIFNKTNDIECIDCYFKEIEKIDFSTKELINDNVRYGEFVSLVVNKYYLEDNAYKIFKMFEVENFVIPNIVEDDNDEDMLILIDCGFIDFSISNFNKLVNCYNSYMKLIKTNPKNFINFMQDETLCLDNALISYILCNVNNRDIEKYILNNLADKIQIDQMAFNYILPRLKTKDITNKTIIEKVCELEYTDKGVVIEILDTLEIKHQLFKPNEFINCFKILDQKFETILVENYVVSKDDKVAMKGLYILEKLGYIHTKGHYKNKLRILKINEEV
ncbi:MAG: hypothetical protein IKM43_00895 [Clostridia bacterium]|nr:hypothetical protein [Clostridia bacterium]